MTFIDTMEELCTFICNQTILETMKTICITVFGDAAVFSDPESTLEDCKKWLTEQNRIEDSSYFSFLLTNVEDIYANLSEYKQMHDALADEESRKVLVNLMAHRLIRDDYYLLNAFSAGERQYFSPSFMKYKPQGVFVDCGALNGATTLEYACHVPDFKRAYVYEPLPKMHKACVNNLSIFEPSRLIIRQAAVSDHTGIVHFDPFIDGSSHISDTGSLDVPAISLDEDITEMVDLIKMDIEGAEFSAICGAKRHICDDRPVLAISVYHFPADLHRIPCLIMKLCPNYHFYLRHHMTDTNETIFYGFPCEMTSSPTDINSHSISQLSDLLVDEYMHVQLLQKDYLLYVLKNLSGERTAHSFFEQQYNTEKEAHAFFELQFNTEKEAHVFFEQQYNAEKEAHLFFEQQFNAEKEAHIYFENQFDTVSRDKDKQQKILNEKEEAIGKLEELIRTLQNDNSKLHYKLQLLKKDSLISKIIKLKKYEV
ncbi:Uncharacterised protein [Hungatella hathewayi]|uniref:Methyltransferase FkbM domain-containing protein n=1 Tax=Hungatella hathewayi TaxID=154046 RepID=A0A6N3EU04_9FIRM|nr:FkbM family methyltransferase [Hungatella effluvii]